MDTTRRSELLDESTACLRMVRAELADLGRAAEPSRGDDQGDLRPPRPPVRPVMQASRPSTGR